MVSVLLEKVTLLVPVEAESAENWKWSPKLLVKVEPVTLTVALVEPLASMCRPSLPVVELSLVKLVLGSTVRLRVPLLSLMIALLSAEVVIGGYRDRDGAGQAVGRAVAVRREVQAVVVLAGDAGRSAVA